MGILFNLLAKNPYIKSKTEPNYQPSLNSKSIFFVYCGANFNPYKSQRRQNLRWRSLLTFMLNRDIVFLLEGIIF